MVLRIVLIVIGVLAAIGLGIAVYQTTLTSLNAFETILRAFASFVASAMTVLGNIVSDLRHFGMGALQSRWEDRSRRAPERKGMGPAFAGQSISPQPGQDGRNHSGNCRLFCGHRHLQLLPADHWLHAQPEWRIWIRQLGRRFWQRDFYSAFVAGFLLLHPISYCSLGADHPAGYPPAAYGTLDPDDVSA